MYNSCMRMVNNEMDAEDILQMSFVDVFMKMDSFRHESTIGAWIKRIVINNCINHIKRKKLHFESLDDGYKQLEDETQEPVIEESDLNIAKVKSAIDQLPDGYRMVFTLYTLEGYDHQEIGEILEISEATSKSQYSRAKKKLKNLLLSGTVE